MYYGWVFDLYIYVEDILLFFYFGECDDVVYVVKVICWLGFDIIFLCLVLYCIEIELMGRFDNGKLLIEFYMMFCLVIEIVVYDYDVIVIDSVLNFGIGIINVVCVVDVFIVLMLVELFDYIFVFQFFDMLCDLLKNVDLQGFEFDVRIFLIKYSNNNGLQLFWMEEQICDVWGSMVLKNVVCEIDEVGKGQICMRMVFEQVIDQCLFIGVW